MVKWLNGINRCFLFTGIFEHSVQNDIVD